MLNNYCICSRQHLAGAAQLFRQIGFKNVIQAARSKRLLLHTHAHLYHILQRMHPRLVVFKEWIVFHGILGALLVLILKRMGGKAIVSDVLWSHADQLCVGHAEKLADVGCVA